MPRLESLKIRIRVPHNDMELEALKPNLEQHVQENFATTHVRRSTASFNFA